MRYPDRPSVVHSAYTAESEPLATAPSYRGTALSERLLEGAFSRLRARQRSLFSLVSLAGDVTMLATAFVLAIVSPLLGDAHQPVAWSLAFGALAIALLAVRGAYRPRLGLRLLDDLRAIVVVTTVTAMAVVTARVLAGGEREAALETLDYWLLATMLLCASRTVVLQAEARARRRGEGLRTLIVGAGRVGRLAADRLMREPERGLRPIGFLDPEPLEDSSVFALPMLGGSSWDVEPVIREHGVQHVVVAFSSAPHDVLLAIVRRCQALAVQVSVLPRLFEIEAERTGVERLGGMPLVAMRPANPKSWQFMVKYGVERLVAAVLLALTMPLWLAAAIGIRIRMGRPVLFRQRRVGADGREFDMLKFRTMKGRPEEDGEGDLDWARAQLAEHGADEVYIDDASITTLADDRRTLFGSLLRRFSVDELPQLLNVVRGEMSLVGPRPERVGYARRFEEFIYRYGDRHRVKSGMTGWAQVNGLRGKTSLRDRVEWDNFYIENWSPWLDVKVLALTFACVLRGQDDEERR